MSQPQLLQIALDPQDIVFTPDWVASDMVSFFQPSGVILDPCKGEGVFLKYLPPAEWCEIREGKDFFAWHKSVDWVFGNPPFATLNDWLSHGFEISNNVVYLLPLLTLWNSIARINKILEYGGLVHTRAYGNGALFGKKYGYAIGAVHFQKGYSGGMSLSSAALPSNKRLHHDVGDSPAPQSLFTPEADTAEGKLSAPAPRR